MLLFGGVYLPSWLAIMAAWRRWGAMGVAWRHNVLHAKQLPRLTLPPSTLFLMAVWRGACVLAGGVGPLGDLAYLTGGRGGQVAIRPISLAGGVAG